MIDDNSGHSIEKFMIGIGELHVDTTPWEQPQEPAQPATRIIHYTHPVNAPMAPPFAKARKQQCLHKFGNAGLCLETCTVVEEVPMADCFVVEDRLWVHSHESEEDGGVPSMTTHLSVTFQIRFVKGTMFRRIIENTTRGEYKSFWNQFAGMIESLNSPSALEMEELEEVAIELEEVTTMLQHGEGEEVPLASALSRIRNSSRRLSGVVRMSSSKKIVPLEDVETGIVNRAFTIALDGIMYLKEQFDQTDKKAFVIAVVVSCVIILFNVLSLQQMNSRLISLDARLEEMHAINELLLQKLASGDASCSG